MNTVIPEFNEAKARMAAVMLRLGCFTAASVAEKCPSSAAEVEEFADRLEEQGILVGTRLGSGEKQYKFRTGGWDKLSARVPDKDTYFI